MEWFLGNRTKCKEWMVDLSMTLPDQLIDRSLNADSRRDSRMKKFRFFATLCIDIGRRFCHIWISNCKVWRHQSDLFEVSIKSWCVSVNSPKSLKAACIRDVYSLTFFEQVWFLKHLQRQLANFFESNVREFFGRRIDLFPKSWEKYVNCDGKYRLFKILTCETCRSRSFSAHTLIYSEINHFASFYCVNKC